MKNEADVYHYLRGNWLGHYLRVENAITSGVPDINSCFKGNEAWFEVKFATTQLRKYQLVWGLRRSQVGGRVYVLVFDPKLDMFDIYKHPLKVDLDLHIISAAQRLRCHKKQLFEEKLFSLLHGLT